MSFAIPFWLKIVGPIILLAMLTGGFAAWSHHQYNRGHKAGVEEVDAQWKAANDKLTAQAQDSATRADDQAAKRAEDFKAQADSDRKAVEDAQANGASPIDVLFGG